MVLSRGTHQRTRRHDPRYWRGDSEPVCTRLRFDQFASQRKVPPNPRSTGLGHKLRVQHLLAQRLLCSVEPLSVLVFLLFGGSAGATAKMPALATGGMARLAFFLPLAACAAVFLTGFYGAVTFIVGALI